MKRKYLWLILIFMIITIGILTYFYLSGSKTYQKIDIYTAKNFNKEINTPIVSVNDKNTLKEISKILKNSEKMQGQLNVVSPNYILEIYSSDKSMETVYLWITEDSVEGTFMYKNSNETAYSISETNIQKLKKIVFATNK